MTVSEPAAWSVRLVALSIVSEPGLDAVPEAVVQHAWGRGLFSRDGLHTTEGEAVRVVRTGRLNRASGPDFSDALVHVGGLAWAGDVEIHRTSADWERHGHHTDPAYDRVVLHVVLSADARTGTLRRADGSALPELVLLPHLDRSLAGIVRDLAAAPDVAPRCHARWSDVPDALATSWLRALGAARLRAKAARLGQAYGRRPDLGALLGARVFRALGYADNAGAMETLYDRLPVRIWTLDDPADVLAALLHASGLLSPLDALHERIGDVAGGTAADVVPMPRESWRRSGRPANAPRTRIAQAAALIAPGGVLRADAVARFADALADHALDGTALDLLRPAPADATRRLGADRARDVFVNAVAPVLLLDADLRGDAALDARVLDVVARLPAAHDRITDGFRAAGTPLRRALDAQGAHALARDFCDEGRCARCAVGRHLWPGLGEG